MFSRKKPVVEALERWYGFEAAFEVAFIEDWAWSGDI